MEFFQGFHIGRFIVHVKVGDPFLVGRELIEDGSAGLSLEFVVVSFDENVVHYSVVAVKDGHEAHDFRAVRDMIRRVALTEFPFHHAVAAVVYGGDGTGYYIVYKGEAFSGHAEGNVGKENVVVYERGAVADFHEDVLAAHAAGKICRVGRAVVVVQQVLGYAGALGFPVRPDAHDAMVDVIAPYNDVYGGVELDAGHFGAAQFHHVVDMVDVVVLDKREDAAHAAYDAALFAVVDVVSSNDVRADFFLEPAVVLSAADRVALHLRRAFDVLICEEVFVFGI